MVDGDSTCTICPYAVKRGQVDFSSCSQSKQSLASSEGLSVIECKARPELGNFEPTIPIRFCPMWEKKGDGYSLKK